MAVADHGEVAVPAENGSNVKFAEKQVATIAENDNSAERNNQGGISGDPKILVGRQGALSTAAQASKKAEAEAGDDEIESVRKAEIKAGKDAAEAKAGEKVETAAENQAAAIKKAAERSAERKAAADERIEMAQTQKAEISADEDAAAAEKTADKVEQAAKKQAAAIEKADQATREKAEKHAAAAKKAAEQAAKKKAAADEKADAKTKKQAAVDEAKAHKQSEKQAAADKKAGDEKNEAIAKRWQTMDEECALGMVHTLHVLWFLSGSQDVLFLLGSPFRQWKYNWLLSHRIDMNKEDAAAATTANAEAVQVATDWRIWPGTKMWEARMWETAPLYSPAHSREWAEAHARKVDARANKKADPHYRELTI